MIFSKPGTARFTGGSTISSDIPLMVMAREKPDGGYVFHASNPEPVGLRRSFVPGTGKTVGTPIKEPVSIRLRGFGHANSVKFDLPTERGCEGAPVLGEPSE